MSLLIACTEPSTPDSAPDGAALDLAQPAPAPVSGAALRLQSVLGEDDSLADYARAEPGVAIHFPADHGPHPDYRSEWWYLTLMLEDASGREYGGQFTLFRQAMVPPRDARTAASNPWQTRQAFMAHLAVTDVAGNRHRSAERLSRGHSELAGARAQPFAAWLEDWRLESQQGSFLPLQFTAAAPEFAWSLTLDSERPVVLQGDAGFSAKGPGQGSHYYSYSRLQARGTLKLPQGSVRVQGTAWLDREWSTSVLSSEQIGWDWFALQLDDGRDLMMFNLRRNDCSRDPFDHGVLVHPDGRAEVLRAGDFRLTPRRQWQGPGNDRLEPVSACRSEAADPQSGADTKSDSEPGPWPLEWQLDLKHQGRSERLIIRAAVLDQRMQTSVPYWEGLVRVYGVAEQPLGRGYLELTGY